MLDLFEDLNRGGNTLCIVTHAKEVADRARRSVILQDGMVVEDSAAAAQAGG
jgi:putative ABC transport system ATP-binding protein